MAKIVVDSSQKKTDDDIKVIKKTEENKGEEVKVMQVENKIAPQRNLKVRLKRDHKCNIGGEWYVFKKGIRQDVPENVKKILARADLLLPL